MKFKKSLNEEFTSDDLYQQLIDYIYNDLEYAVDNLAIRAASDLEDYDADYCAEEPDQSSMNGYNSLRRAAEFFGEFLLENAPDVIHEAMKDSEEDKYHIGQKVKYNGKVTTIVDIENDPKYGIDLLIANPDYDGNDSRYENIWVADKVDLIDESLDEAGTQYDLLKDTVKSNLGVDDKAADTIINNVDEKTKEDIVKSVSQELTEDESEKRIISTSLDGKKENEVLNSVIGQMSDGIWENSSSMNGYWMFANVTPSNEILIDTKPYSYRYGNSNRPIRNKFSDMSDDQVVKFFATKIKQIVKEFCMDHDLTFKDCWNAECDIPCDYLGYQEKVTIGDAFEIYRALSRKNESLKEDANDFYRDEPTEEFDASAFIGKPLKDFLKTIDHRTKINLSSEKGYDEYGGQGSVGGINGLAHDIEWYLSDKKVTDIKVPEDKRFYEYSIFIENFDKDKEDPSEEKEEE